jgi:hypothetical protein
MPLPEIQMAVSSFKAMTDIFNGVLSLHIDSEVKAAIIEAQNQTLQLQTNTLEILAKLEEQLAENAELKEKLTAIQRWDETKAKYEMVELYEGRYAYKLRSPSGDIEPKLRYCVTCFDSRNLVLLQELGNTVGVYQCPACKHQLAPPKRGGEPVRKPKSSWMAP